MGRPRTRPIIITNCAYCGIEITVTQNTVHPNHNRFCCMEHRNLFKMEKEPPNKKWNNKTLINEYRRIRELVGHYPTAQDIHDYSTIYITIFQKRFGTLDNIAKLAYPEYDVNADDWNLDDISDTDGGWLAGICSGEGCFRVMMRQSESGYQFSVQFQIQLRADDIRTLEEINRLWKLDIPIRLWDRDHDRKRGINAGDAAKLLIRDIPTLFYRVLPTLEKYPMRGKKQDEIPLFKRAILIIFSKRQNGRRNSSYTNEEKTELEQIYWAMREMKEYKANLYDILSKHSAIMIGEITSHSL